MNNEVQDKQYIALELTKILFGDKVKYQQKEVLNVYQYFLLNITNLYEVIGTFELLKNENERLQKEILKFKANNRADFESFANELAKFTEENKSDMETYVYDGLINLCNKKI